jgi:hypothetical protein
MARIAQWHIWVLLLVGLLGLLPAVAPAPAASARPERPIVAQIVNDPSHLAGRVILIYGLVIDSDAEGRRFFLQDVSQRPLAVAVAANQEPVAVGDELEVLGTVEVFEGDILLRAERIAPTKVLGGGGCC